MIMLHHTLQLLSSRACIKASQTRADMWDRYKNGNEKKETDV
jgi:hypothetical protein